MTRPEYPAQMDSLLQLTTMTASGCLTCGESETKTRVLRASPLVETDTSALPPESGSGSKRVGWSGVIGVEGEMTGDGRLIDHNSLRWENLPLPLRYVSSDMGAHDGAMVVGRVDTIRRSKGGAIHATGEIDLESDSGREAARQIKEGLTNGVSMDLDDVSFEVRVASELVDQMTEDGDVVLMTTEKPDADGKVTIGKVKSDDEVRVTTSGRIRAATIVAIPAFSSAKIALTAAGPYEDVSYFDPDVAGQDLYDEAVEHLRAGEQYEYLSDEYMNAAAQAETLFRQAADAFMAEGNEAQAEASAGFADSLAIFLETDWSRAGMGDVSRPDLGTPDLRGDIVPRLSTTTKTSNPTRAKVTFATSDEGQAQVPLGNPNTGQWRDLPGTIMDDLDSGMSALGQAIDEPKATSGAARAFQTALDSARQSAGQADDAYNADDYAGASSNAAKAVESLRLAADTLLTPGADIPIKGASAGDESAAAVFIADVLALLNIAMYEMDGFAAVNWGGLAAAEVPLAIPAYEEEWLKGETEHLIASGFPDLPPASWFSKPRFKEATALTVTKEGRVYGHLASWGTCHIGQTHKGCVTAPHSASNYAYFATGTCLTKEGSQIPVGHITLNTRHAGERLNAASATAHYDNTGSVVADVAVGEDSHGIWVAGACRSTVTDAQVRALRAAPLSGDWRSIRGTLELVAALAVNVPGFPIPRPKGLVAGGEVKSLVASGMIPPRKVLPPGTPGAFTVDDLQYLKRLVAREKAEDDKAALGVLTQAEALSRRVRTTELAMKRRSWRT